jgi:threonylcarbamoyladenosine tRNA methylthiotransferase MtaB
MKYSVITFGCRVNQADSLAFEDELRARGAQPSVPEDSDIVIVNTCSVTASADQGARQTIRRISRANPRAQILVTGCYATRAAGEVRELPGVDQVVCNDDKPKLLSFVRRPGTLSGPSVVTAAGEVTTAERFGEGDGHCGASIRPGVAGRTAYTLRAQTGCDEPCSYCIIPETRGAPRSVPVDRLLLDIERLRRAGFKEVALTGVHLGSYGRDLTPPLGLIDLLSGIRDRHECSAHSDQVLLFRISSLEPMDCTREVVTLIAGSPCFAPHFHLPLQHASDHMLQAMRRPYDISYYAALVERIRRDIPHASIGTDVIVGFPGETDGDFEELAGYLQRSPLTHVHVFPYSDRPGTAASRMGDRPSGAAVKARGARIREIGSTLYQAFVRSQVGTSHRALTLDDGTVAVTGNYLKVRIPPGRTRNEWIDVRIGCDGSGLVGEIRV